ncbi:MAG: 16S rRNA (guanine(966)-N(2))-methyltransferase [Firmicutes bacterium]|nr:16S rRNA (guanine(966)-N(2))-methyltransferase [Bacillota bacterium]
MRIIAGCLKGRKLKEPKGRNIRPTADRVKEAVFSIIAFDIQGKRVLDLFAGTGNLGLEALSRGANYSVFVDSSREALTLVKENIKLLGLEDRSDVLFMDAFKSIEYLDRNRDKFDIIFIDPPYREGLYEDIIKKIAVSGIMNEECIVVIEHPSDMKLEKHPDDMKMYKQKKYGNTKITIMKRTDSDENSCLSGQF